MKLLHCLKNTAKIRIHSKIQSLVTLLDYLYQPLYSIITLLYQTQCSNYNIFFYSTDRSLYNAAEYSRIAALRKLICLSLPKVRH